MSAKVLSPEQVAEYRALADAATPGLRFSIDGEVFGVFESNCTYDEKKWDTKEAEENANLAFLNVSRTAVPALCDSHAELQRQLREIRELVIPNDPDDTHASLMAELNAWDRHSSANITHVCKAPEEMQRQNAELLKGLKAVTGYLPHTHDDDDEVENKVTCPLCFVDRLSAKYGGAK